MKRSGVCLLLVGLSLFFPYAVWAVTGLFAADSGQSHCYDGEGNRISCPQPGEPFYGQDAHYDGQEPSYQNNGNETVTDLLTGLVWIESKEEVRHSWHDAIAYCSELLFADADDWRLPSKEELETIVNYNSTYPALHEEFSCRSSFYWSSTPHLPNPPYAWGVYCLDGADHWLHKSNNYSVRCVRSSDSEIEAKGGMLEWEQPAGKNLQNWQDALDYCETLSHAEKRDWRLPNLRELKSLADYSKYYPAAAPASAMESAIYWSSTTVGSETPSTAWAVFFGNGDDLWREKSLKQHVRCVRSAETP